MRPCAPLFPELLSLLASLYGDRPGTLTPGAGVTRTVSFTVLPWRVLLARCRQRPSPVMRTWRSEDGPDGRLVETLKAIRIPESSRSARSRHPSIMPDSGASGLLSVPDLCQSGSTQSSPLSPPSSPPRRYASVYPSMSCRVSRFARRPASAAAQSTSARNRAIAGSPRRLAATSGAGPRPIPETPRVEAYLRDTADRRGGGPRTGRRGHPALRQQTTGSFEHQNHRGLLWTPGPHPAPGDRESARRRAAKAGAIRNKSATAGRR